MPNVLGRRPIPNGVEIARWTSQEVRKVALGPGGCQRRTSRRRFRVPRTRAQHPEAGGRWRLQGELAWRESEGGGLANGSFSIAPFRARREVCVEDGVYGHDGE